MIELVDLISRLPQKAGKALGRHGVGVGCRRALVGKDDVDDPALLIPGNIIDEHGVVGGAVAASAYEDDYQCYVLTPTSEDDATIDPVDDKYMLTLLKGHDELLSEYQTIGEKKKRCSPEIVIPLFKKLGLIKGNSITETCSHD